jgi:hypothetical protein
MTPALAARAAAHDPRDPDPWLALELDRSLPIDDDARRRWSGQRELLAPVPRAVS